MYLYGLKLFVRKKINDATDIYILTVDDNINKLHSLNSGFCRNDYVLGFKNPKDQHKRILSRLFLFNYCLENFGSGFSRFLLNEYGKPFLKGVGFEFNISYSKNFVAIAINKEKNPIGVDIEFEDVVGDFQQVINLVFHKEEINLYNKLTSYLEKKEFFYSRFSQKESIVKALGIGLNYDLRLLNTINLNNVKILENNVESYKVNLINSLHINISLVENTNNKILLAK